MENQLELIGVLFNIYGDFKDLKVLTVCEETLIASNYKRFIKGLESSIKGAYEHFNIKNDKFSAPFKKPWIYNLEFETFVMSNNYYDEYPILFNKLQEYLSKIDKGIWKWFDIKKQDSFANFHYMIPFGQFLGLLKKENQGAVIIVNKI